MSVVFVDDFMRDRIREIDICNGIFTSAQIDLFI